MMRQVFALVLGVWLLGASNALAYCRTTTCAQKTNKPAECTPGRFDGSCQLAGKPLFWKEPCASFSVQVHGSKKYGITADELQAIGRDAFDAWQGVDCSSGDKPNLYVETYPQVECGQVRYNQQGPNQNTWVFRDDAWLDDDLVIALTTVMLNPTSGEIYDADLEFNSYDYEFDTGSEGSVDLRSVVQHESGHMLGLAHSDVPTATMHRAYGGRDAMSSLGADDTAGICAVYPPVSTPSEVCDAEPRHGFSTQCGEADAAGCSCEAPGRANARSGPAALIAILGLFLAPSLRAKRRRERNKEASRPLG